MKASIAQRIVKPGGCVIAFAIPTSRATFERHLALKRHLASSCGLWPRYEFYVTSVFDKVAPALHRLGAQIQTEVNLSQFCRLFDGGFDAVILFAHWLADSVEFDDGFANKASIIAGIPDSFNGLLDLCVCHPRELVGRLDFERPHLLTKSLPTRKTTPRFWLYFYVLLFTYLRDHEVTYLEALEAVISEVNLRQPNTRDQYRDLMRGKHEL